jgi:hypothetical protein
VWYTWILRKIRDFLLGLRALNGTLSAWPLTPLKTITYEFSVTVYKTKNIIIKMLL